MFDNLKIDILTTIPSDDVILYITGNQLNLSNEEYARILVELIDYIGYDAYYTLAQRFLSVINGTSESAVNLRNKIYGSLKYIDECKKLLKTYDEFLMNVTTYKVTPNAKSVEKTNGVYLADSIETCKTMTSMFLDKDKMSVSSVEISIEPMMKLTSVNFTPGARNHVVERPICKLGYINMLRNGDITHISLTDMESTHSEVFKDPFDDYSIARIRLYKGGDIVTCDGSKKKYIFKGWLDDKSGICFVIPINSIERTHDDIGCKYDSKVSNVLVMKYAKLEDLTDREKTLYNVYMDSE